MVPHFCIWQERCDEQQSKGTTKLLDDRSQHCTSQETHSDGRTCNFAAYGIWPWFILGHCAAYRGRCVTVPWGLSQTKPTCINRRKQSSRNDGQSLFPATLCCIRQQLAASSLTDNDTRNHHFTTTSKQSTTEWKHTGSRRKKNTATPSAGKMLASGFWDSSRVLLVTFWKMREALSRENVPLFLAMVWFFSMTLPDRTWHTGSKLPAQVRLGNTGPSPSQSGFGTRHFHLFLALKEHLTEHRLTCDENGKLCTTTQLTQEGHTFIRPAWSHHPTLWQVPQQSRRLCSKQRTSDNFAVYCQFPVLKHCLRLMGAVNLLSDLPS